MVSNPNPIFNPIPSTESGMYVHLYGCKLHVWLSLTLSLGITITLANNNNFSINIINLYGVCCSSTKRNLSKLHKRTCLMYASLGAHTHKYSVKLGKYPSIP